MIEASTTTAAFIVRSSCFVCVSASVVGACGNGNGRLSLLSQILASTQQDMISMAQGSDVKTPHPTWVPFVSRME